MIIGLALAASAWLTVLVAGRRSVLATRWSVLPIAAGLGAVAVYVSAATDILVSDRSVYLKEFRVIATSGGSQTSLEDPLFVLTLKALSTFVPHTEFALFGALGVACAVMYLSAFRVALPWWAALMAFATLIISGFFFAYTAVAVRQGLAVGFVMLAIALRSRSRVSWPVYLGILGLAALLHWSALAAGMLAAAVQIRRVTVTKLLFVWAACAVLFVTGLNSVLFARWATSLASVDRYSNTASYEAYGVLGNRLDFLAVSTVFLIIGLLGRRSMAADPVHDQFLKSYIVLNAMYLVAGFVAFSDRLAVYSWFLFPVLLWRPLAKGDGLRHDLFALGLTVALLCMWWLILGGPLAQLSTV